MYTRSLSRPNVSRRDRLFSYRRGTGVPFGLIIAGFVFLIVAFFTVGIIVERATLKNVTFTVQDKAVTIHSSNSNNNTSTDSTYMIYTDHGSYKDEDSLAFFKFNSADVYGQLKRDHKYTCRVTGFRVPLLSSFNNIIDCREVK